MRRTDRIPNAQVRQLCSMKKRVSENIVAILNLKKIVGLQKGYKRQCTGICSKK